MLMSVVSFDVSPIVVLSTVVTLVIDSEGSCKEI